MIQEGKKKSVLDSLNSMRIQVNVCFQVESKNKNSRNKWNF